MRRKILS